MSAATIHLRPLKETDRAAYLEACRQETGMEHAFSSDWIQESMWMFAIQSIGQKIYAIEDSSNGDFCGYCSLTTESAKPEIGIGLLPAYQGQGIGKEAITQLMEFTCKDRNIEYFRVRIDPGNIHSIKLFQKLNAVPIPCEESGFMKSLREFSQIHPEHETTLHTMESENETFLYYALFPDQSDVKS